MLPFTRKVLTLFKLFSFCNFRVARLEVYTPGTVDGIKNAELSRRVKLPDM